MTMKMGKGGGGVSLHGGMKTTGDRVPMGVTLPKRSMSEGATRSEVPKVPSIGPRTA
jgi:hypothetical protein